MHVLLSKFFHISCPKYVLSYQSQGEYVYVITLLNWAPVYGKAVKNLYKKVVSCYDKIGLYAQNISTIASTIVHTIGRAYVIV